MNDRYFRRLAGWSLAVIGGLGVVGAVFGEIPLVLGMAAGGVWNIVNLFCLVRLLTAWLGPPRPAGSDSQGEQRSTRRVVGWILLKFFGLYVLAVWLLRQPAIHPAGFGLGFTVVLATAVTLILHRVRRLMTPLTHDR